MTPAAERQAREPARPARAVDGELAGVVVRRPAFPRNEPPRRRSPTKARALAALAAVAVTAFAVGAPLRVHPTNSRYFTDGSLDENGRPRAVYLTGSHTWSSLVDMARSEPPKPFDFPAYLDFLQRHQHNFVRLWTWDSFTWDWQWDSPNRSPDRKVPRVGPLPWARTGPGLARDGRPKFDLTRFDREYFDRLRARVLAARDRGVYVSVMLFEGWGMFHSNRRRSETAGWAWRSHPFHPDNNINGIDAGGDTPAGGPHRLGNAAVTAAQTAYLKHVVDTVNDLDNVLYEVANEGGERKWNAWVVETVRAYERSQPQQHAIGITGHGAEDLAGMLAGAADWISPGKNDGYGEDPPAWNETKVSLLDTDHIWGVGGTVAWAWKSFLRGHNPIFMDPYDHGYFGRGDPAQWDAVRASLGHTRRLADRVPLAAMRPCDELASSRYCLAQPGVAYVAYLPERGPLKIDLTAAPGKFQSEWIHPTRGTIAPGKEVTGGAMVEFESPFETDAVLHLYRRAGGDPARESAP